MDPQRWEPHEPHRAGPPRRDEPRWDEPRWNEPRWDEPRWDPPSHWGPQWHEHPDVPLRRPGGDRRRLPVAVAAGAAAAGVVAVLGFVTPGFLVTRVLDTAALQEGVITVLAEDHAVTGVTAVSCPQRVRVEPGAVLSCRATIDGQGVDVPVRIVDGAGTYEVGRPG